MNRRRFSRHLAAALALPALARAQRQAAPVSDKQLGAELGISLDGGITDVDGIQVGSFTDARRPTGCTVILCDAESVCGVDVRGGWPGTRLTDALDPVKGASNTIAVDAVVLSGGSNYGLATATGVEQFLRERYVKRLGSQARPRAFAVPAAIIYDLTLGDWTITPNAEAGYQACLAANKNKIVEGNYGAGAGATVGKMFGNRYAMKAGLGTSSIKIGDTGVVVGAIVAVNAIGDVINPLTGKIIAGARAADGKGFANQMRQIRQGRGVVAADATNTTIAVVATNAAFNKTEMSKIAQMASAGLARAVNPIYTTYDGDAIFAVSTGKLKVKASHGMIGAVAAEALAEATVRAAVHAAGIPGFPGYKDVSFGRA